MTFRDFPTWFRRLPITFRRLPAHFRRLPARFRELPGENDQIREARRSPLLQQFGQVFVRESGHDWVFAVDQTCGQLPFPGLQ
jgi:hypothetical protein